MNISNLTPEFFANTHFSMTIWWQDKIIDHIELGPGQKRFSYGTDVSPFSENIAQAVSDYESGNEVVWNDPPLDWSRISSLFLRRVLKTLFSSLSFGQIISYGRLAEMCGCPKGARAVGRAMSLNPWPLIVPCHRVLAASGKIGGFSSGTEIKKKLLYLEGRFDLKNGCITGG